MKKLVFYFVFVFVSIAGFSQNVNFEPVTIAEPLQQGDYYGNRNAIQNTEINHASKSMSMWALAPLGATSGNTRIPGNTFNYQRTEYLITAAEIAAGGFPSGSNIDGIGWLIYTAGATSQTGTLNIWLKNTTDVTYTLGTAWTTTGFTQVSNNTSWTVPIALGAYTVNFTGGSPFTYTGGGVYIAWEFSNPGAIGTTALIANCNTSITNGLYGQRSTTALPSTLAASNWRPATSFVNNSLNDIIDITNIYSLERIPTPFGTPAPINVRVANVSASAATFNITITVKDVTNTIIRHTETQTVSSLAGNTAAVYTFSGWTPTINEDVNITATTTAIAGETWTSNNTRSKVANVNNNLYSYNYNLTGAGGFGFSVNSSGLFASKFTMNGSGAIPGANIFIANNTPSTGNTIYAVVLNSAGTIVAQSANYVIQATDLNTNKNFTFPSPPVFTNEVFYVAMAQTSAAVAYFPMGTFNETPGSTGTYYTSAITGGVLSPVATTFNLKYGIEAQVVAFSGPSNPTSFTTTTINPYQINLSYLLNASGNNVLVAYNTTNSFGAPINGTTYNAGDAIVGGGTVLQYSNSISFSHTALTPSTTYYYKIWSFDGTYYSGGVISNATTFCSNTTVPFTENFDNATVCGTVLDANADNIRWSLSSLNAFSGTKKLSISYSALGVTMNDWYFTQGLNLNAGQSYDVKFFYRAVTASFPERLEVKWGTAASVAGMSSPAIFNNVDFTHVTYTLGSGTFSPSTTGTYYLGWHCYSQPDEDGIYLDSISVIETPSCPLPSALTASNITSTQAILAWAGSAPSWEIQWGVQGFTLGTGTIVSGITTPDTLTGLIPSTAYSYYIRSNCGGGLYSIWVGPYTFNTLCASASTPFTENFESTTFPPNCWTNTAVSGSFTWTRSTAASANGEGTASILANFYDQSAGTYDLKTMPVDILGLTNPTLKFNYAYATYSGEIDQLNIYYSSDYGSTWASLSSMPGGISGILNTGGVTTSVFVPTAAQWNTKFITLPVGTNMVKFTAISAYGNNLYLDNIMIYSPFANDVTTTSIDLYQVTPLGNPVPKATVSNIGLNAATFDVTLTIGSYTSTKTVTALASNASIQVIFDAWNNEIGDYTATITATFPSDMDLTNNTISKTIKVMNLNKTVYAYQNATISGPVKFNLSNPETITLIANQTTQQAINGGSWANGVWYGTATNTAIPYNFIKIDTITGIRTVIGDMGIVMNGLSYNTANSTMYGVSYNSTTTQSSLYSINMNTGAVTLIGNTSANTLLINLAINNNGECYSVDIFSDQLGLVNLTTGVFTPIGSIGFNAGYAQDMEFDRETNELYMAAYGSTGELRWVDKTTGNTLIIGEFQNGAEITGFAIPYSKTLNMKVFLEGLYTSNGNMNQTQNETGAQFGLEIADKITVELYNSTTPSIVEGTFSNIDLHTNGTFSLNIPSYMSDSYYIVIKHRNSIATCSSLPLAFAGTAVNYDFTTLASQAFGDNQKQVETGVFAVFTGDVNQDGVVDLSDLVDMDTDLTNGTVAYIVYDLNGDGVVDLSDLVTIDANLTNGVVAMTP
jgi:hypothetical protein